MAETRPPFALHRGRWRDRTDDRTLLERVGAEVDVLLSVRGETVPQRWRGTVTRVERSTITMRPFGCGENEIEFVREQVRECLVVCLPDPHARASIENMQRERLRRRWAR